MVFDLSSKTHIIMDCDGVLWKGNQPVPGARETLEQLEQQGFQLGFVTNNSSLSRNGFSQKFLNLGFNSENYTILNSGYGAAVHLKANSLTKIFMIGELGLKEELEKQNLIVSEVYKQNLQAVCIGWDRDLTWAKLADGMWVILKNKGLFLATNPDNSFPFENRLVPGAGAGIAALANACGKEPDIMIGKPSPYLLNLAMEEMDCKDSSKAVFIGDRLSTDIKAGINAKMDTILVTETGISEHHLKKTILPTYTLESIAKIDALL